MRVNVDANALREILTALMGPAHAIREIQAISMIRGDACPIKKLVGEFNAAVDGASKEGAKPLCE